LAVTFFDVEKSSPPNFSVISHNRRHNAGADAGRAGEAEGAIAISIL
jgi:hypothetical protein